MLEILNIIATSRLILTGRYYSYLYSCHIPFATHAHVMYRKSFVRYVLLYFIAPIYEGVRGNIAILLGMSLRGIFCTCSS